MEPNIVVLAAQAPVAEVLAQEFARRGAAVFSASIPAAVDLMLAVWEQEKVVDLLLVDVTGQSPEPSFPDWDFALLHQTYDKTALAVLRAVEAFLPLMPEGQKQLGFIIDGHPVQKEPISPKHIGVGMAKAALMMALRNLQNDLRREGYAVRVFDSVGEAANRYANLAADYFLTAPTTDRFVICDVRGKETVL